MARMTLSPEADWNDFVGSPARSDQAAHDAYSLARGRCEDCSDPATDFSGDGRLMCEDCLVEWFHAERV